MFNLTGPQLLNTLSQMTGEGAAGQQQATYLSTSLFLNAMLDPFVVGRAGSFGPALSYAPEDRRAASEVASAFAMFTKAPPATSAFEQRWSVWGSAYGGKNRTDGEPTFIGSHDLRANAAGFAGGADYRVSPYTVIGAAVAIGETRWRVDGHGGGRAEAVQVGGYASTRINDFYLSGAVAAAWHRADTDRTVNAGGVNRFEADFDAHALGLRIEGGRRYGSAYAGITPYAAVQVQSLSTPNYRERTAGGANAFALTYTGDTTTDTRSEVGAWVDTRHAFANGTVVVLRARGAWVHDFDAGRRFSAAFQTLPGASFTIEGASAPHESALASAVAEIRLTNGVTLIGKFDGEVASGAWTYAGTGTIKYAW